MAEKNMSLLSQSEIDTLIDFLSEQQKEGGISGDILSQNSINKLIELVKSMPSLDKNILINTAALETDSSSFLSAIAEKNGYELTFKRLDNGQLVLFACNIETDDTLAISPDNICGVKTDNAPNTWGTCIPPLVFDNIAKQLNLSYSKETLEQLTKLFAKEMYGDENTVIPALFLP